MTTRRDSEGNAVRDEDGQPIFDSEQRLVLLPATQTFQFTFYPHLRVENEDPELLPRIIVLKVEGDVNDGTSVYRNYQFISVTPSMIYLSKTQSMNLDPSGKVIKQFRFKRDVRHNLKRIRINCDRFPHGESEEKNKETE